MNKKELSKKNDVTITDQNWLLLKYIEQGKSIKDAYKLAGYEGDNINAPYQLYHRLKKKLESVYEADNIDSLRLKIAAKRILDMQVEDKPVKPETHLRAIETLQKLTEVDKSEAKAISPFIVFKAEDGKISASQGKVIEAVEVEEIGENGVVGE